MAAVMVTPPASKRIQASGMKSDRMIAGTPMKCVALLRASWWYAA